ncbi:MAG: SCP2 sterol-binding domain-containing protein [Candidatus Sericytochromatia bacterium]|nr:SCP2 sterol-binding domain-containing protein [Candidatus Tanganyikabacteria bacterium]
MSLRDRVAVVGVGATRFGEHFDRGYPDLAHEAAGEALAMAGIEKRDIQAAWLGTCFPDMGGFEGNAGSSLADALGLFGIPVTRVANYCATGMDAFRNACFAVAAGVYDRALVVGVEKMRDVPGRESLVAQVVETGHPVLNKGLTAPGIFAMCATAYLARWGADRDLLAEVAVKNHEHGERNPRAHLRRRVTREQVLSAPMIAEPLGLFDCCPQTDGAAAAVITRPELVGDRPHVLVKGVGLAVGSSDFPFFDPDFDFLGFRATRDAAAAAYREAGIADPAAEIQVAEVHDCFTITELLNYEDLGFCGRGEARRLIEEGVTRLGGRLPVNPSGGLKSCGHPIGASGVRMIYEISLQLLCRAEERQAGEPRLGLAHNLGGAGAVACVTVLGAPAGSGARLRPAAAAAPAPLPLVEFPSPVLAEPEAGTEAGPTRLDREAGPGETAEREANAEAGPAGAAMEGAFGGGIEASDFFAGATAYLRPDADPGQDLVLRFDLGGHRGGTWTLVFEDGQARLDPANPRSAAIIMASAEDFEAILAGRLSPQMAFMTGRLKIRGDMNAGMKFRSLFCIGEIPTRLPPPPEAPRDKGPTLPEALRPHTSRQLGDVTRTFLPDVSQQLQPEASSYLEQAQPAAPPARPPTTSRKRHDTIARKLDVPEPGAAEAEPPGPTPAEIMATLPDRFDAESAQAAGAAVSYHIAITAPEPSDWSISIQDGELTIEPGKPLAPDATLLLTARDWAALVAGELSDKSAILTGRIKVRGSKPEALLLKTYFRFGA